MISKTSKGFGSAALIVLVVVLGVLSAAGYYVYQSNTENTDSVGIQNNTQEMQPEQQNNNQETEKKESTGTVITTGDSEFGTILFDGDKQAIYIWEVEETSEAECYGSCADAWPPVLTNGTPKANGSVNGDLLGTTERTDGTTQVTYNGHPLYYYAHEGPGEVRCHNVSTHGGLWWVIHQNGTRAA